MVIDGKFEWLEEKEQENIDKHHVAFKQAERAFDDPCCLISKDQKHSRREYRKFCIGDDGHGILTVRFTMRNHCIHIIGAGYWRKGKAIYGKANG
jgi:uncharacterized DUF497 family protein